MRFAVTQRLNTEVIALPEPKIVIKQLYLS